MIRIVPASLALFSLVTPAVAGEQTQYQDAWFDLVPGHYVLVGRLPDNGATYSGTAVITVRGQAFRLERTTGTRTISARGTIEVPSPPREGKVLRFRWNDKKPHLMTCLVQGDLDNYARLTCYWGLESGEHKAPGLEAYFPTQTWPQDAPDDGHGNHHRLR